MCRILHSFICIEIYHRDCDMGKILEKKYDILARCECCPKMP